MAQLHIKQRQAGDVAILDLDGEVRIGIFGTTNKEAILSQLRPVIASQREPGFASLGKD